MSRLPRHRSIATVTLACLLLLSQWAGFSMVLCVKGPGHIEVESLNAPCCGTHAPGAGMSEGNAGACVGCKDLSIETASAWDPSRRLVTHGAPAVTQAFGPVCPAPLTRIAARSHPTPALAPFAAAAPLRC